MPEILVLTSALEWVPVGKIGVGDELIGVDEFPEPLCDRKFRKAAVLAVQQRRADCVTVNLEDGRQVTCPEEHMLLTNRPGYRNSFHGGPSQSGYGWVECARLRPGDQVASPLRTWGAEASFEAGWLSGIFDGEGTCSRHALKGRSRATHNTTLSVAQNPGPVLDRIEAALGAMGIHYRREPRDSIRDNCMILRITPRSHQMELLGRLRTTRLIPERVWEDMAIRARDRTASLATVAEVRPIGNAETVSVITSTGTYLAEGLASHS